jgi:hypothetical protein
MARYRHDQPKPVGTILGVVVCLGAVGGFLILISTGVIKFGADKNRQPRPPVRGSGSTTRPVGPVTTDGGTSTAAPTSTPSALGEVRVYFIGKFTAKGDTRKISYKCPHCQQEIVDVRVPKCTNCAKSISWPTKVPCKFCGATGKCTFCKGTGKCPKCGKGRRMLMGLKAPCDVCDSTRDCPACDGNKTCTYCEGGNFYPGKPKSTRKPSNEEPPPIPKPKSE